MAMSWTELTLKLNAEDQAHIEAVLEDVGALSITLLDAEDHPILEPAPGETPLWPTIALAALFESTVDRRGMLHVLGELLPELTPESVGFREVEDQDWTRVWMDQFQPMQFGRRLWIYPSTIEPPDDTDAVIVRLDPGLAFGTGTHPTTALCLEWLDAIDLRDKSVIDYGCGSGVLAIAAIKLGAAQVIGVDNDPQAIAASHDNAQRNGVAEQLVVCEPAAFSGASVDVVVANILAGPLMELAPRIAALVKPAGDIALSGILREQGEEVRARYAEWFENLVITAREDWVRISGKRR